MSSLANKNPNFDYKHHPKHNEQINKFIAEHKKRVNDNPRAVNKEDKWHVVRVDNTYYFSRNKASSNTTYFEHPHSIVMFANCSDNKTDDYDDEQRRKKEQELWDKLKDKLSDDDITNIVNNYGDDIDIDKYCASGATCYFIENEFEKEINNNDYDIDKVTNENCNVRNGKIYSCPNAKKKKDDDDDDDKEKKDDDDESPKTTKKDDDDKPINCKSSEFHKKVCDWIDWTQKKFDDDSETKVKVKEEDEPTFDKNRINFNGHCPSPEVTTISYAGVSQPIIIRYDNYCAFFIKLKPLLIGVAGIISVMIISGRKMGL